MGAKQNYLYFLPTVFLLFFAVIFLMSGRVFAYESPSFPTCTNPQGTIIAQYDSGIHGIIGDYSTHTGKDTVYQLSDSTIVQCFCDKNNNGIQTNWWKVTDLSDEEISYFLDDGWLLASNGADWGLEEGPYLAKNTTFNCLDCVSPTPSVPFTPTPNATPSATPTLQLTLTPTPQAGQSGTIENTSQGQVQSVSVQAPTTHKVIELANTGNSHTILMSTLLGIVSFGASLLLKKVNL